MLLLLLVAGLDARVFGKKSITVQMKANQNAANFTITIGVIVSRSSKTGPTTYLSSMYPSHGGGGGDKGFKLPATCTLLSRFLPYFCCLLSLCFFLLQNIVQCCIILPQFSLFPIVEAIDYESVTVK